MPPLSFPILILVYVHFFFIPCINLLKNLVHILNHVYIIIKAYSGLCMTQYQQNLDIYPTI